MHQSKYHKLRNIKREMEDKLLDQWLEETTIQRLINEMLDKVE